MDESLIHRYAKNKVRRWIKDAIDAFDAHPEEDQFSVREEWPICIDKDGEFWGMGAADYMRAMTLPNGHRDIEDISSHEKCLANGLLPRVRFDLALFRNDEFCYAIEVVYKNSIDAEKLNRLRSIRNAHPFAISTVDANWVLNHIRNPLAIIGDSLCDTLVNRAFHHVRLK